MFDAYHLRKWSVAVRVRDKYTCQMCTRPHQNTPHRRCQAHHIYPKSLHPELAYNLFNGICLCWRCHMQVVHKTNSNWKRYAGLWHVQIMNHIKFNTFSHTAKSLRNYRKTGKL